MVTFHANGIGGRALEELIDQGLFAGVLDFVTHELADQLYNGYCGDSIEDVPDKLKGRRLHHHDIRVAVRTSEEEL